MEWLIGKELWTQLSRGAQALLGITPETLAHILNSLVAIGFYFLTRELLRRTLINQVEEPDRRYRLNRAIKYCLGFLLTFALADIWFLGRANIATYLGIVSAGLAIALQDPLVNLAGWIFLMIRQPFRIGDRIQVGEQIGDVVDVGMQTFSMLEVGNWVAAEQSTGRIIHLPNGHLFKQSLSNYTQGFEYIWNEIPVVVTFESDWERAHTLLTSIGNKQSQDIRDKARRQLAAASDHYRVSFKHLTPIVWLEVADIGVKLTLRYLCHARAKRSSSDRIWRDVLAAFSEEPTIDFAYPTQRFYNNTTEGKSGAGGPST